MSRRVYASIQGLRISLPGYDAGTGSDDQMMFYTNRRSFMMLDGGAFVLSSQGQRVSFTRNVGQTPMIICGTLDNMSWNAPTGVAADAGGFNVYALTRPGYGDTPALGKTLYWTAFLKGN